MRKIFLVLFTLIVMLSTQCKANATVLISAESNWNYSLVEDNKFNNTNWDSLTFSSYDWDNTTWQIGQAAFGNTTSGSNTSTKSHIHTEWSGTPYGSYNYTDLVLQKDVFIDGNVDNLLLNFAIDDRYILFVNGNEISRSGTGVQRGKYWNIENLEIDSLYNNYFKAGNNKISLIVSDDMNYETFFDMQMTANVTPVPEPSSMVLGLLGLGSMLGFRRKKST